MRRLTRHGGAGLAQPAGAAQGGLRQALAGLVLLLPLAAWAQSPPSFWSAASGYGSSCTSCHGTPPKVNAADLSAPLYSMLNVGTTHVQTPGSFNSFFFSKRTLGAPMLALCNDNGTSCAASSDLELLRQYLMDVLDARVGIGSASGVSVSGGAPVQSSTTATPTATVNFGRRAAGSTSPSVTFTVQSGRGTNLTLGTPVRSGGDTASFVVGARSCTTLNANYGNSCTFTVSFSAGAVAGAKTTTLQIPFGVASAGDTTPATRYITLSGTTNAVPVANAGANQSVTAPTTVNLSGTGSSDGDGDALTYSWTLTTRPAGSAAALSSTTSATPSFTADKAGTYIASLVVSDGFNSSTASTVTITAGNTAPVANAGANRSVTAPVTVNLSGSGSDANGDALTYSWTLPTRPAGSAAVLSGATTATPSFAADKAGTYVASLVVNDGISNSVASTVTITAGNTAPVANAGANQAVTAPVTVNLSGSGSDANGDALTYSWTLPTRPAGSAAVLSGATTATPSFAADKAGTYVASLVVNDGTSNSVASTVTITAGNTAPVAAAGSAQSVLAGAVVNLSGSGSDANGDTLTYSWTLPTRPGGSAAVLSGATTATPSFTADVAGTYVASLVVNDGSTNSVASTVTVTATSAPGFALSGTPVQPSSQVGVATSATLTVSNTGNAALVLANLALSGAQAAEYSLGGTCSNGSSLPGTLAPPRSSCTVVVNFTPAGAGTRSATLTLTHNDSAVGGGTTVVPLAGIGTTLQSPVLDMGGTTTLAFGSVLQGASAPLGFTVRNGNTASNAFALTLSALTLSGAAPGDYTLGGSCSAGSSLGPGASCTVTVNFAPQAAGSRTASLAVVSNAGSANVTLSGTGVALADATLGGVPLTAFPSTLTGTTSATTRTLTIVNPRANAIGYTASFSGTNAADFAVAAQSCATRVVPGGGSCTLTVAFAPLTGAAGARSATLGLVFTGTGADPAPATLTTPVSGTAELPAPVYAASAGALALSAVVGSPTTGQLVVTNTGTATLTLGSLGFSGAQASDFALATGNGCTAGLSLAPSNGCTLIVRYAPAAAGAGTATLTITSNAAGSPHAVALSGTATPAPTPRIALSALSATFANTFVGAAAATQTVTVQNTGDAALSFSGLALAGAHPGDFSRSGTCAVGTPLAPAAQCTLVLGFTPTADGARSASLAVSSDAANGNASIALAGTGVPVPVPVVSLSASGGLPLDFGPQTVGGLYPARRITLANSGTADLVVSAVGLQGAAFAITSASCAGTLAPGATCAIDVRYAPTAAGVSDSATLSIASNAAGSPHSAELRGRGTATAVPVLTWEPAGAALGFGQTLAGAVSAVQSATLRNSGPGGVTISLLNAVGTDAAAFSVTAGSCVVGDVLFEGQSCTIDVRFAPANAGAKTARVQVASNGSAPADLALSGTGLGGPGAALALSQARMVFGAARVGTPAAGQELTLTASGAGVLEVQGWTTGNGFTVQTKGCPLPPFSLAAGASCTLTVGFVPAAVGAQSGQLQIQTDAGAAVVALEGNGVPEADLSSGGCSLARGHAALDPTLWLLALLAALALWRRRGAR